MVRASADSGGSRSRADLPGGTPRGDTAAHPAAAERPTQAAPGGDDTKPAGKETVPAGKDTKPTGKGALPAGKETKPAGKGTKPAGKDTVPAGFVLKPTGKDTLPTGFGLKPAGKGKKPTGKAALPVGLSRIAGEILPGGGGKTGRGATLPRSGFSCQRTGPTVRPFQESQLVGGDCVKPKRR